MPTVSVIVPNYNHAQFLPRRLDSILSQTFTDFEVIILDDASGDNSREVIASYLADPRIRFYPNEKNSGSPFIQWNRGVQLARGKFVWIAESDDYAEAGFLATLVPQLTANPKLGLIYCQSRRVDSLNNERGNLEDWTADLDPVRWKTGFLNFGRNECANYLFWKNTVPNASAVLMRKDTYLQAGEAPVDMRLCGDWMTWVRMLLISDVAFTPLCLNNFRKHDAAVRENTNFRKQFVEKWAVRSLILCSCNVSAPARRRVAKQMLNELIVRVRMVPSSERWHEIVQAVTLSWPVFFRIPITIFGVAVRSALRFS